MGGFRFFTGTHANGEVAPGTAFTGDTPWPPEMKPEADLHHELYKAGRDDGTSKAP